MIKVYSCHGADVGVAPDLTSGTLPSGAVWVDAVAPDGDEKAFLERAAGIELPNREQLSEVESSSRLRRVGDVLYLSLPVVIRPDGQRASTTPVGLVLSRDRLVTIRYDELRSFDDFRERLKRGDLHHPSTVGVLVLLLEAIVDRLADVLEGVAADLDTVTDRVFGAGSAPIEAKAAKKKSDAHLRATLGRVAHDRQLVSKTRATLLAVGRLAGYVQSEGEEWLPDDSRHRFEILKADVASLDEFEVHLSDKVQFLLDAALGLISIEQNDTFRVLTLVSVVGIPPTLVASLYGMNFKHMPELDWAYGYPYGLALIAASAIAPLVWFRARGWF